MTTQAKKVLLTKLKPMPDNPRIHTQEQITAIARSLERWGWRVPVLIDEGNVVLAGHARVEAAKSLGWKRAVCIVATGWSDIQKRQYAVVDNRISELSVWDPASLQRELEFLAAYDITADDLHLGEFDFQSLYTPDLGTGGSHTIGRRPDTLDQSAFDEDNQLWTVTCEHCGGTFTAS